MTAIVRYGLQRLLGPLPNGTLPNGAAAVVTPILATGTPVVASIVATGTAIATAILAIVAPVLAPVHPDGLGLSI